MRISPETRPLQVGAVNYLNSKPLIEGLAERLGADCALRLDYPSRLADDLAQGRLNVALIPSIEYFRGHDYEVVSDACVAAHGPVLSVKMYSRVPWGSIRTLALDEGSRTSATLARILLAERHGVVPELQPLPLDRNAWETQADALLLIGDRAIFPPSEPFDGIWDLGEEWFDWTGLPFVFAMWVAGPCDQNLSAVEEALGRARDQGVRSLVEIARREAPLLGLSFPATFSYLSENLQYHLGSAERQGLRLFYDLASSLDLAPENVDLRFRSCLV